MFRRNPDIQEPSSVVAPWQVRLAVRENMNDCTNLFHAARQQHERNTRSGHATAGGADFPSL